MTSFKPFLFPPINRDISPLALRPLLIAGMVTPVVGGDAGVNNSIVKDNPAGVLSIIDPYDGMLAGDRHRIFWEDGVEIASKEVLPAEVDERLFIYLPNEKMLPDWAEKVFYQLTRFGTNIPEDSVPLRVRVKLDRPAGDDREPHYPWHSELQMPKLPQDVIENGVDADWAARGVPVEVDYYPCRAARDTVSLKWGSVILRQQVTESEANGTAPITMLVDQAAILAGGDSAALLVQYEVFDEVLNFSERWSKSTTVLVDAGAWRLDPPIIKEAVNGVIDLIALAKNDVTVQIVVNAADFKLGDTVTMTWIGTPQSGKPIVHTEAVILSNVPTVLELKVPYADIRAIAQGSGDASYVLTKVNADPPQSSKRTFARVVGEVSQLPAPSIIEVIGEVLDSTTPVANVQIPAYPGMDNGDFIDVIWLGTTASNTPYLHEMTHIVTEAEKGKVITLPVLNTHIAPLDRGTLDLYYRVSNDKYALFAVSESEHLLLKVEQIRAELPAPKVVEAIDGVLDPTLVPDSATLLVDYLGTAPGDVLTYYWIGKPGDGTANDWVPITTPIAGKPITFRIANTLITPNIGSIVKVRYTLKRAATGQFSYSATLDLTIGSLVGELPAPVVLEAPNGVLDPMDAIAGVVTRASYTSMDPALDLITLKWLGTPGAGSSEDLELPGNSSGSVDFRVPASVVGPNIGKPVDVSYEVKRYGSSTPSDVLKLTVSNFKDPANELPLPRITQANDASKELILDSFTGNATVTVGKWPFSAAGQRVWLRLEGQTSTGANYTIALLTGVEISAAQASNGLNETLLRSELEKLGHATPLTVVCNVTFDGAADENSAIEFPRVAYTFKTFDDTVVPTITSVRDTWGEVVNGGTTFDTSVTLAGKAAANQQVEIFDVTTSKGTAPVNSGGDWTLSLSGLTVASYSITAKALYGSNPMSDPRTFTVAVATVPTITSVRGSGGAEIPDGGRTFDTSVTLAGKAAANQQVEIFDGTTSKGTAPVNAGGDWTLPLTGLSVASYSIKARGLYASNPESAARTFSVASQLIIDTSPVTLSGRAYIWNAVYALPAVPAAGTSIQRSATGGTPPYTYRTSTAAVSVNATGLVRALRNGTANITVRDLNGTERSYQVTVTDAWIIEHIGNFIHRGALEYQRPGGHLPYGDENQQIRIHYGASWPLGEQGWWSADTNGIDALVVTIPSGSAYFTLKNFAFASLSVYR